MKKIIALFIGLFISSASIFASEEPPTEPVHYSMGYYSFGAGFPSFLYANFGRRVQHHHHGFDVGVGLLPPFLAQVYFNYLIYPKPSIKKQYYLGSGTKCLVYNWFDGSCTIIAPTYLTFGRENVSKKGKKRFIQLDLGGIYITSTGVKYFPLLQLSYGLQF